MSGSDTANPINIDVQGANHPVKYTAIAAERGIPGQRRLAPSDKVVVPGNAADTGKTAGSWFGACVFLIVAATVLRSFFL